MHNVSDSWDREINAFAFWAPQALAYSGISLKWVMKGFAKPLVIWRDTPRSIENMKKIAMSFFLNNAKALSPKASATDLDSPPLATGQAGRVNAYAASTSPMMPEVKNWL